MKPSPYISVIIPVYNEQDNIKPLLTKILPVTRKLGSYEVIFIDDGSTDFTLDSLKTASGWFPNLRVIKLAVNSGKTAAYNAGFKYSSGKIIITMDGDLQDNPEDIPKLIKKLEEGYDLVKGWKCNGKGIFSKTIASKFFNFLTSLIMGTEFHDMNCPMRAMTRDCMKNLRLHGGLYRFIPLIAKARGFSVTEIKIDNSPRFSGNSKYGFSRLSKGFFDLITVYFLIRFQEFPLHFFGLIGGILFMLGFLTDLFLVLNGLLITGVIGHFAMLLFGVLLMLMGVQFLGTGLIGELVISLNQNEPEKITAEVFWKNCTETEINHYTYDKT